MADSTSRWAEALREMSSRLEEMPGEEGYPAYLSSRLAEFYERAGLVETLGGQSIGAVTAIGAVSPPGGDTSEPVSQATLRIVKVFWGLSSSLAYKRHFPAIDWLNSYSLYEDAVFESLDKEETNWSRQVRRTMALLQEEASLEEIVRLVGIDTLSPYDRIKLITTQMIREDYLHQNAFNDIDTYTSLHKQYLMLNTILTWYDLAREALDNNKSFKAIDQMEIKEQIGRLKYVKESKVDVEVNQILDTMRHEFDTLEVE